MAETSPGHYTNYGVILLRRKGQADDIFQMCLDSWYYGAFEVGKMELGSAGVAAGTGVADFITQQMSSAIRALSVIGRPDHTVRVVHRRAIGVLQSAVTDLQVPRDRDLVPFVRGWLEHRPDIVVDTSLTFDLNVIVRTFSGRLAEQTIPNAMNVSFWARIPREDGAGLSRVAAFPWTAFLSLDVLSLFRRDNTRELQGVRDAWENYRFQDPEDAVLPEDADADALVTLMDPPEGTPNDNAELSERNLPRLLEAISRWESLLGTTFLWDVKLP